MSTGFYLLDYRPTPARHFYPTRLLPVLAEVVHITAGLEDLRGADLSAEQTSRYAATTDRPVSWHSTSDADSAIKMLPDSYTAWHCHGYNSCTCGHEICKRHTDWRTAPPEWVERTLRQAASVQGPRARRNGVPFRWATKAELDRQKARGRAGVPVGFVEHFQLDDARRNDAGQVTERGLTFTTFPRARYLDYCRQAAGLTGRDWFDMATKEDLRVVVAEEVERALTKERGKYISGSPISVAGKGAARYAHWALEIIRKAHPAEAAEVDAQHGITPKEPTS